MSLGLNDAGPQTEFGPLIPDGTFAMVRMTIKAGGHTLPGQSPRDNNLFTKSKTSDVIMLELNYTILFGPHAKRTLQFQNWTIAGGKLDEQRNSIGWGITKKFLRGAVESAMGIDPKDDSPAAQARRDPPDFASLDGLEFAVRIDVEPGGPKGDGTYYNDKNRVAIAITPDKPEWAMLKKGEIPEPAPVAHRPPSSSGNRAAADPAKPAWQTAAAPAQASPTAGTPAWQQQVSPGARAQPAAQPPAPAVAQPPAPPAQAWPTSPQPQQPQPQPPAQPAAPSAAPTKPGPAWLNP